MAIFAVEYTYDESRSTEMDTIRPKHREFLSKLVDEGKNAASGPWINERPGALIVIVAESVEQVETILNKDPFHEANLISKRVIRQWNPIIGSLSHLA